MDAYVAYRYISIVLSVFCFGLVATFPGWQEAENSSIGSEREIKPFPSRPVSMAALACALVAFLVCLMSIFWQHLSSSATATMVKVLTYGTTTGHVGATAMALGWVSVLLLMTTTITILVIILRIRVTARVLH